MFGIDLGTTFSGIARIDAQEQLQIIPNAEGHRFTPSVVYFEESGKIIVGRTALRAAPFAPHRVVTSAKRRLGDPEWIWEFEGRFFRPADISALILAQLKRDAERHTGESVDDVVITVPAHFNEIQRAATMEAAELAGLRPRQLLNEPTAAALAFGTEQIPDNGLLMVLDLGGGTFDVTLLEALDGHLHIKATNGRADLGGEDWDALLLHRAATHFVSHYGLDPLDDPTAYQHLKEQCIAAKHTLSEAPEASVLLAYEGHQLHYQITESEFHRMSQSLLGQMEDLCHMVLEDHGSHWADLAKLLLVGGASQMPMIEERFSRFVEAPSIECFRADEAVLYGAALQAAALRSEALPHVLSAQHMPRKQLPGAVSVEDITAHTLGLVILDRQRQPLVDVLIPRYSPLPYSHKETYYTAHDRQTTLHLRIVEGESPVVDECVCIGEAEITGLPPRPAGQRIDLHFRYDESGILSLTVDDIGAGTQHQISFARQGQRSPRELETMRRLLIAQDRLA